MAGKNLFLRLFFSIFGFNFCLVGILFLGEEELANWIAGIITFSIGLLILSFCWIGLITRGKINANTLFPLLVLIYGIVFFGGGICSLVPRIYTMTAGECVTARIEGFTQRYVNGLTRNNPLSDRFHKRGNEGIAYVSYEIDGKEYLASLNEGSSTYQYGQLIEVVYIPKNPDTVYPYSFRSLIGPFVITIAGMGVLYLWKHKLIKRKNLGNTAQL